MLAKYHFKIEHIKGTDNARADTLNRKAELQGNKKPSDAILRMDEDGKIKYNHPKLAAVHKVLELHWM